MFMTLRWINLVIAVLALTAPVAHVLELPNKLALDGPLWLAVQQHLYRGWGVVFGPVEILALASSILLAVLRRRNRRAFAPTLVAVIAYGAMLAVFFLFDAPVNRALSGWTAERLPPDWTAYRLRWEIGHALAALAALIALVALRRARLAETVGTKFRKP
jgi:hypothetical protein